MAVASMDKVGFWGFLDGWVLLAIVGLVSIGGSV